MPLNTPMAIAILVLIDVIDPPISILANLALALAAIGERGVQARGPTENAAAEENLDAAKAIAVPIDRSAGIFHDRILDDTATAARRTGIGRARRRAASTGVRQA